MLTITTNRKTAATNGELAALQEAICNAAAAEAQINRYRWVYEQLEDISAQIQQATLKVGGWCLVTTLTGGSRVQDCTEGLYLDNLSLTVAVGENVSLNRGPAGTKIPVTRQVEQVARALHASQIDSTNVLNFLDFGIVTGRERGIMLYNVRFTTATLITETGE
jgi:hypothetical protein